MLEYSRVSMLDEVDKAILNVLQTDGRISNVDLASRVNLSPPATYARLKRLEERGYINHYAALLNWEKLGYDGIAFINVTLQLHQSEQVDNFKEAIRQMPEVLECYHLTGEFDYLLKVVIHNRKDLERFVVRCLTPVKGVARIHTSIILNEVKSTTVLPLD